MFGCRYLLRIRPIGGRTALRQRGLGDGTPIFDFNQKALNRQRLSGGGKRPVFRS